MDLQQRLHPMVPRLAYVVKNTRETHDTVTIVAAGTDGVAEFEFLPGQFHMIGVPGVGEIPVSISGDASKTRRLVHTIRDVGAVSHALTTLRPGESLTVRGPYGQPWPVEKAEGKDVIVLAGGIGLAPLRPVIYHIMNYRAKYGKFALLYGARSPEDILYRKELAEWRSSFGVNVSVTVDRASASWHGDVGVVTKLISRTGVDPENTIVMICGPEIMMRYGVEEFLRCKFLEDNIYLSMERNMKCGFGHCGHCQLRGEFICRSGPVYPLNVISQLMEVREL